MKYNKKRTILRSLIILFILSMLSFIILYYLYSQEVKNNLQYIKNSSINDVSTFKWIIKENLNEVYSDLIILQDLYDYNKVLNNKDFQQEVKKHFLTFIKSKNIYDQIRFLDKSGNEIIRVNYNNSKPYIVKDSNLQNKKHRYYFKEAMSMKKNCIYASPLDLNIENKQIELPHKPMVRLAIKVYSWKTNDLVGVIVVNYLANKLLDKIHGIENLNKERHLFLLNNESYYLHHPEESKEWGFMLNQNNNKFSYDHKKAYQLVYYNKTGQFSNNEGLYSFNTIFPLHLSHTIMNKINNSEKIIAKNIKENYYWKIVSFTPISSINRELERTLKTISIFYLFTIFVLTILSTLLSIAWEKRMVAEEELRKKIEELTISIEKIKKLEGILPLCSYCKKVRDDEGYWNQVDQYIHEHSEAQVSHSICPDCVKKYHPKIAKKMSEKRETP